MEFEVRNGDRKKWNTTAPRSSHHIDTNARLPCCINHQNRLVSIAECDMKNDWQRKYHMFKCLIIPRTTRLFWGVPAGVQWTKRTLQYNSTWFQRIVRSWKGGRMPWKMVVDTKFTFCDWSRTSRNMSFWSFRDADSSNSVNCAQENTIHPACMDRSSSVRQSATSNTFRISEGMPLSSAC